MRTITSEVGCGPIAIASEPGDELESNPEIFTNLRTPLIKARKGEIASDGKVDRFEPSHRWTPTKAGRLVSHLDNGPDWNAANDNNAVARQRLNAQDKTYPLREMYNRGELGINEPENRRHWFASQEYRSILIVSRGEMTRSSAVGDWEELMLPFLEGIGGNAIDSLISDPEMTLSDDMEFEDSQYSESGAVDFARWDVYRDLPPAIEIVQAKQTIALAANVLGADLPILDAAIDREWTARMIGETQGFNDRASASACGKGMLRSALRNLSQFYVGLQRLEWGLEGANQIWPLVGTTAWMFPDLNDGKWAKAA